MLQILKQDDGFTLIELMIGIAVVGILSTVAIPNYISYREKARIAQAESDLKMLELVIMDLALDTNKWPGGLEAGGATGALNNNEVWDLNAPQAGIVATDGGFPGWAGPYLESVPRDPWGNAYFFDSDYQVDGQTVVVIGSFGPNGAGPNVYDDDDVILILPAD